MFVDFEFLDDLLAEEGGGGQEDDDDCAFFHEIQIRMILVLSKWSKRQEVSAFAGMTLTLSIIV